jgi:hypothetical protein
MALFSPRPFKHRLPLVLLELLLEYLILLQVTLHLYWVAYVKKQGFRFVHQYQH